MSRSTKLRMTDNDRFHKANHHATLIHPSQNDELVNPKIKKPKHLGDIQSTVYVFNLQCISGDV